MAKIANLGLADLDTLYEFVNNELHADRNYRFDTSGLPTNCFDWLPSTIQEFLETNGHDWQQILLGSR